MPVHAAKRFLIAVAPCACKAYCIESGEEEDVDMTQTQPTYTQAEAAPPAEVL
jgi:hypothetical protein